MPRVYVDLDDVLAQTALSFTRLLAESFGKRVAVEEITSFDLSKSFNLTPEEIDRFMAEAHRPEHLIEVEPIEGAVEVLDGWHARGLEIDVLTGRPPASSDVSRRWLDRHRVPHRKLYFVDKYKRYDEAAWKGHGRVLRMSELDGDRYDLVIEDSLKTAAQLAESTTARILLLDKPWNRDVSALPEGTVARLERCRDWTEVAVAVSK